MKEMMFPEQFGKTPEKRGGKMYFNIEDDPNKATMPVSPYAP